MDADKLKKKQSLKVIISEAIMVLAVVALVSVLALIVSGYWLNSDFEVERQGMLQVSSIPTGADLSVDGESSWLQRTNTSKVVSSGEHTIVISKEGYDTWTKQVNVSEGLLYRIHYPRLFLQERESEKILNTASALLATISPDRDKLLLIGDTTEWSLVNINDDNLEPKKLNISDYFSEVSLAEGATNGLFTGQIISADWDRSGNHVLFKVQNEDGFEWVLIDVDNIKNSLNLTKEFGANFSKVEILDNSSNNLLAVQNDNLHKIDVPGKSISSVLVNQVANFDHYENEVIFSAKTKDDQYLLGLFKIGSNDVTELERTAEPVKVTLSKFYDEMYITTLQDNNVTLYKKADFTLLNNFELGFAPKVMEVGHNGEFITMYDGSKIATLDMETRTMHEWNVDGDNFGWLDNDMIYSVADGELIAYDFDGANRRVLAKNASGHFPVAVTNDKWLYYFSDGNLIREWLIKR